MIDFVCAACDAEVPLKDGMAGKKVRCPKCGNVGKVPDPGPAEEMRLVRGREDDEEDTGYRCPYCRSRAKPTQKRRRTMAGNIIWCVLFVLLLLGLAPILSIATASGNYGLFMICTALFIALFVGGLYLADRLCTEWQYRCPDCRRRCD